MGKFKIRQAKLWVVIFFMKNRRDLIWFPENSVPETDAVTQNLYHFYHWTKLLEHVLEGRVNRGPHAL